MSRAVDRWLMRGFYEAWEEGLRKLAQEPRVPASEEFEALQQEPPPEQGIQVPRSYRGKDDWRREAQTIGLSDQAIDDSWAWYERNAGQTVLEPVPEDVRRVLTRQYRLEDDWRRDARAAGLSAQEIEESWTWYSRNAFSAPPVLEEAEPDAQTMPGGVRRVLTYNSLYLYLADDPRVDALVDQFKQPIPNDLQREAEDWRFWDDITQAWGDPSDADVRPALDRLANLVHLKPEHTRHLAEKDGKTMAATKRRLVQDAVLLSLGVSEDQIRVGRRKTKNDPGHPITLEEIFGRDGLQDILRSLAEENREPTKDLRDEVERSLGGPFRPASLADREVYRNWLTKEIRRRTVELLGQDLDIKDAGRAGGTRRKEISYDETEPLIDVAKGGLEVGAQTLTDSQNLRAAAEREDRERAFSRTTDYHAGRFSAWEKKDRMELALAHRIDWHLTLDRVWRKHAAPELRQYIHCVRDEPLLRDDNLAAAQQLGWTEGKVRDVKRRLNIHIAQIAAERRLKSLRPNAL